VLKDGEEGKRRKNEILNLTIKKMRNEIVTGIKIKYRY
jgi:hypothetical protein